MVQQAMRLHLKILIETLVKGSPIHLSMADEIGNITGLELNDNSTREIEYRCEINYSSLPSSIRLFSLQGFVPQLNQKIIIKELTINDRKIDSSSFFDLLDFRARDDGFTSGGLIKKCREICLDGDLLFSVEGNRDRLFWCPYYYSNKKDDFVFNNSLLDDRGSGVRGYFGDPRNSIKKYRNSPHHDYETDSVYDFACFGCSVTYGVALEIKDSWPNLLSENSLNLAVPSLGIDGIFLNLKNSLEKFHFKKIIILFPNFERRIIRLRMPQVQSFCQIPVNSSNMDWHHSQIKHWSWEMMGIQNDRSQLEEWKENYIKKCKELVLGRSEVYSKKIFNRLLSLLSKSNKKFYLSSWDEEVYDYLSKMGLNSNNILPFFKKIDRALDGVHPGPLSHAAWVDLVKEKINGTGQDL